MDIEPVFPWLFQSNSQKDWWSIWYELSRKYQDLQASQILLSSQLSDITMPHSVISLLSIHPGFLPQTHQVHFFTRTLAFAPVYLKCASFRTWQDARLTHLKHVPPSYPPGHLPSQGLVFCRTRPFWNCLASLCVASVPSSPLYSTASMWARLYLFWSPSSYGTWHIIPLE